MFLEVLYGIFNERFKKKRWQNKNVKKRKKWQE